MTININQSKMKIVAISILLLFSLGSTRAQTRNDDYVKNIKEQLVLKWPKNKTINLVFHGHSVPSGYFTGGIVSKLGSYPHLFLKYITEKYPTAVVNSITTSIGGEQSEQGAKRFKDDVLILKPDLLFIDYALNDRSIGLERTEKSWRSMIGEAISANVKIVLLTPTPDLKEDILDENAPLEKFSEMIRKLGSEYQIPVIDVYSHFKALKKSGLDIKTLMSQNNHPNELGHQEVLKVMVEGLFK